jgi:hypothetical protein
MYIKTHFLVRDIVQKTVRLSNQGKMRSGVYAERMEKDEKWLQNYSKNVMQTDNINEDVLLVTKVH